MAASESDLGRLVVTIEARTKGIETKLANLVKAAANDAGQVEKQWRRGGKAMEDAAGDADKLTVSLGQQRAAATNLSFQLQDIAQGLASGTSPFTLMAQQGGQVVQALQSAGGGVKGLFGIIGSAASSLLNPLSLATFAIIGLTAAATQYFTNNDKEIPENDELIKKHSEVIALIGKAWGDSTVKAKEYEDESQAALRQKVAQQATDLQKRLTEQSGLELDIPFRFKVDEEGLSDARLRLSYAMQQADFAGNTEEAIKFSKALQELETPVGQLAAGFLTFEGGLSKIQPSFEAFVNSGKDGRKDFISFYDALARIANDPSASDGLKEQVAAIQAQIQAGYEAQRALKGLTDTEKEAKGETDALNRSIEENAKALRSHADAVSAYADLMGDRASPALKKLVEELEYSATLAETAQAKQEALDGIWEKSSKTVEDLGEAVASTVLKMRDMGLDQGADRLQKMWDDLKTKIEDGNATTQDALDLYNQLKAVWSISPNMQGLEALISKVAGLSQQIGTAIADAARLMQTSFGAGSLDLGGLGTLPPLLSGGGEFFTDAAKKYKEIAESLSGRLIADFERFREKAYPDKRESTGKFDAWRVGFGSDTITDPVTGMVSQVTKDTMVTWEQAMVDLGRRITKTSEQAIKVIGGARFAAFDEKQKAAVNSIVYNYGKIPDELAKLFAAGASDVEIAQAWARLGKVGVNRGRREQEAKLFASNIEGGGSIVSDEMKDPKKEVNNLADAIRATKEATDVLNAERVALGQTTVAMDQLVYQTELARKTQELLNIAKRDGTEATPEEVASINATAEAYARQKAMADGAKDAAKALADTQKLAAQRAQELNAIAADALGGLIRDLIQGKDAGEALANMLGKIGDRLLNMGLDLLFNSPAQGGAGLLGGFLKMFGFFAKGGPITGRGGPRSDRVPIMASPGEYMVNADATRKNRALLEAINSGKVQAMKKGGLVRGMAPTIRSPNAPPGAGGTGRGGREVLDIVLQDDTGRMASIADQQVQMRAGGIVRVSVAQANKSAPAAVAKRQFESAGSDYRL